ncbi:MAG: helix-turn-helix domain-containing protein [Solirubrobacteraceae bacterium]
MAAEEPDRSEDPWLTLAEIADQLRMSPATIRSWISKGTLRAMRAGQRKWLVRQSELDRMLRGEDFEDVPSPPPDPPEAGRSHRQRRFPDTISAPGARPGASTEDQEIDREQWLAVAEWEWLTALEASRMAPPDAWFVGRLRHIAEAAARKAAALELFDADEAMRWEHEPVAESMTLSYELRPGGNRPGPATLWTELDRRVDRLGAAMKHGTAGAIRAALDDVSLALHDIAEALERYRGRYGNWAEPPPGMGAKKSKTQPGRRSRATE